MDAQMKRICFESRENLLSMMKDRRYRRSEPLEDGQEAKLMSEFRVSASTFDEHYDPKVDNKIRVINYIGDVDDPIVTVPSKSFPEPRRVLLKYMLGEKSINDKMIMDHTSEFFGEKVPSLASEFINDFKVIVIHDQEKDVTIKSAECINILYANIKVRRNKYQPNFYLLGKGDSGEVSDLKRQLIIEKGKKASRNITKLHNLLALNDPMNKWFDADVDDMYRVVRENGVGTYRMVDNKDSIKLNKK
jgi:hypothetical protein